MALWQRQSDFGSLFRLLDDYDKHRQDRNKFWSGSFAPRFDVRETKEIYHLDGELPGVNEKDIDIEFTDPQTLVVKGKAEKAYSAGAPELAPGHRQATVEDVTEGAAERQVGNRSAAAARHTVGPEGKYWVSERSVGEFQRTFSFPTRVDQDGVRASLKQGILSVTIPKATTPTAKKITIG